MTLGVDSSPLVNPRSGAARYTINTLRHMMITDVDLVFLGPRPHPDVLAMFPRARVVVREGRRVIWYMLTLRRLLQQTQCDAFWGYPLPVGRSPGIRYITSILDLYPLQLPDLEAWSWERRVRTIFQRWVIRWLIGRSISVSDEVIALSHATAQDIQENFGISVERIAYPAPAITEEATTHVNGERLPPDLQLGRFILAVGGYEPYRNRRRLLEAFAKSDVHKGYLVIAGRFSSIDEQREYQTLRDAYGLQGQVHYLADVDDKLLSVLYRHAIGVIHPTLCEGFGIPVVEALSFGKPVAISKVRALIESAGDFAVTQFDPYDVMDMARALAVLFALPDSTNEEVQQRKVYADKYNWERTAEVTWQAISGVSYLTARHDYAR